MATSDLTMTVTVRTVFSPVNARELADEVERIIATYHAESGPMSAPLADHLIAELRARRFLFTHEDMGA